MEAKGATNEVSGSTPGEEFTPNSPISPLHNEASTSKSTVSLLQVDSTTAGDDKSDHSPEIGDTSEYSSLEVDTTTFHDNVHEPSSENIELPSSSPVDSTTFHDKAHEPPSEIGKPPDSSQVDSATVRDNTPTSSEIGEPSNSSQVDSATVRDNAPLSSQISQPRDSLHVDSATVRDIAQGASVFNESRGPVLNLRVDSTIVRINPQASSSSTQANQGGSSSSNIAACWTAVLQRARGIWTTYWNNIFHTVGIIWDMTNQECAFYFFLFVCVFNTGLVVFLLQYAKKASNHSSS